MSIYSDYKVGAITEEEYKIECAIINARERWEESQEEPEEINERGGRMTLTSNDYEKRKKQLGYKGCRNCKNQIEPLRMCEWAEQGGDGKIHLFCPRWEKKESEEEEK